MVETVADDALAGSEDDDNRAHTMIERLDRKTMPHITELKQEIKDLKRQDDEGNLYSAYEPARLSRRERDQNITNLFHPGLVNHKKVKIQKFKKSDYRRGLQRGDKAVPVSPKIGPYEIKDPLFGAKNYYWCSCGMSNNQPFCDMSHVGTSFKPLKFSLDEEIKEMHMCGCKMSSNAPFCDGITCEKLLTG